MHNRNKQRDLTSAKLPLLPINRRKVYVKNSLTKTYLLQSKITTHTSMMLSVTGLLAFIMPMKLRGVIMKVALSGFCHIPKTLLGSVLWFGSDKVQIEL